MSVKSTVVLICIAIFLQISYAGNARFMGMGNLTFLFQDDYQKLDLYDFAGISAGFLENDGISSFGLRGSGLREEWQRDSVVYWAFGQSLPKRLVDYVSIGAVNFYDFLPQLRLTPNEFFYESRRLDSEYGAFGEAQAPQAWGIAGGYSWMTIIFAGDTHSISTPALDIVYSRSFSDDYTYGITFDGFYGSYNHEDLYTASFLPLGGGLSASYNSGSFDVGINAEYHYPMFSVESPFGSESFNGHAISPSLGAVVKMKDIIWATALHYRWMNLSGSYAGRDIGDVMFNAYTAKTQIMFTPGYLHFSVFGKFDNSVPTYIDQYDNTDFELLYRDYIFGGGAGIELANVLVGIEGVYLSNRLEDRVAEDTLESTSLNFRVGAEFGIIINLCGRIGYGYNQVDLDYQDSIYTLNTNVVTGGLGIDLLPRTRIDLAYNYKWTTSEVDPDEKVTDHIVFLYLKHTIVADRY